MKRHRGIYPGYLRDTFLEAAIRAGLVIGGTVRKTFVCGTQSAE